MGKVALDVLIEEQLSERAAKMGAYFQTQLKNISSPLIKEVRGKGLLIGVEIDERYPAHDICKKLLGHGLLTKETHNTVIRLAPPLVVTEDHIDTAVTAIKHVLADIGGS